MAAKTIDSGAFRNPNRDLYVNLMGTKKQAEGEQKKAFSYPRDPSWWTGPGPVVGACPGMLEDGTITSIPFPDITAEGTRQGVLDYFKNTWTLTEVLFSGLLGEDTFTRTPWHQLRHPMMFYFGHVGVVYVNKLRVAGFLKDGIDDRFEQIMETGVDEMSWDDLSKNEMEWPPLQDVVGYRKKVYDAVCSCIMEGDWSFPIKTTDPAWAIVMGTEHERIHLETSSVLIRELPAHLVTKPKEWPTAHPSCFSSPEKRAENAFLPVKGGTVNLGKPLDFPSFGWDNEYGSRTVEVESFHASKHLITNGEFLDFVKSGGYTQRDYWTEAGWQWRRFRNVLFPTFWVPDGPVGLHQYKLRLIFEIVSLPLSWPVDCNAHEAAAYCNWKSSMDRPAHPYRLISECEHNLIRHSATTDLSKGRLRDFTLKYPGSEMSTGSNGDNNYNTQLAFGSSSPVDALPPSDKGFFDTFGNVWQWTSDDFNPLDGFEVSPLYLDFSTPCFDGLHTIILGGSFVSTSDLCSPFSRFHFRPHFHQHAGFRMAYGPSNPAKILPKQGTNGASVSNSDSQPQQQAVVNQAMTSHYGLRLDVVPWENGPQGANFVTTIADLLTAKAKKNGVPLTRALDLGCAVGGSTFQLALSFPEVVGIDASPSMVDAANEIKREGQRTYLRLDEDGVLTEIVANVDNMVERTRVSFFVDDATSISPAVYGVFDCILLANALEGMSNPAAALERVSALTSPGGMVVVTCCNAWYHSTTPRAQWLGGFEDGSGGEGSKTVQGIQAALGGSFELVEKCDVPRLQRIHA
eukprot:CAMPEP_0114143816 /NCGR_PEP_ID=MMETSP0043_2-20121206/19180_1 /TAXON_ID=464988 /ORGANISM="Hemiselmis andersenii, Strain CCMP644" /LENGTH=798 /DNA_ID=CAMNT_0001238123 /DNA_START=24 /DNA_END=2416 /DNA_ORIENTATION=+